MRVQAWLSWLCVASSASVGVAADSANTTNIHEAGRCAIRGHCGKQSLFGSQLPCPDNDLAEKPSAALREQLVSVCGDEWSDSKVCCKEEQLNALKSNLDRAKNLISACPACKKNFYDLFCTFTCSPDQSLFVNVTDTVPKDGKYLVTELDHLVSDAFGGGFYDSCKDVKFGASGNKAMDLIGGGAKNFTQFLKFLGDKRPFLGSPFQIDFPRPDEGFEDMHPVLEGPKACNSSENSTAALVWIARQAARRYHG